MAFFEKVKSSNSLIRHFKQSFQTSKFFYSAKAVSSQQTYKNKSQNQFCYHHSDSVSQKIVHLEYVLIKYLTIEKKVIRG